MSSFCTHTARRPCSRPPGLCRLRKPCRMPPSSLSVTRLRDAVYIVLATNGRNSEPIVGALRTCVAADALPE